LLVPGMLHELTAATPCPPALATLLRFARRGASFSGDYHAWRCHLFGVARQQDDPVAPFSSLGEGLEPGTDYWLCANPVSLHLQRDSFVLADAQVRGLAIEEAHALTHMLNEHFAAEGMHFYAPHANRWYLRLARPPVLETHPLSEAIGQSIQRLMPQGDDAMQWQARINEIQMLLHEHPVSLELERRGESPVNSLWLWGGGVMEKARAPAGMKIWADDPFSLGLAQAHGNPAAALPNSAMDWTDGGLEAGEHLVVLDQLVQADLRDDQEDWRRALQQMERHWFVPLLTVLRKGAIARLDLHLAGTHGVSHYTLTRNDLYKFWRRRQPLGAYLG
jgi:hypothetical protein